MVYAKVIREYVPRIKGGYPRCRIVAVMARQELQPSEPSPWRDTLLGDVADLIDVIEVQTYGESAIRPEI